MSDTASAFGTIVDYAFRLDHYVLGETQLSLSDQTDSKGLVLRDREGKRYTVHKPANSDYAILQYEFNIAENLGREMTAEQRLSYLNADIASEFSDYPEQKQAGAVRLETEYGDELESFSVDLRSKLDSKHCYTTLLTLPTGSLSGFRAVRNIFPTNDAFTLPDYNDAVREVLHVGSRGVIYLAENIDFMNNQINPDELEAGGQEIEYRSFQ